MTTTSVPRERDRLQARLDEDFPMAGLEVTICRTLPFEDAVDTGCLAICARARRTGEMEPVIFVPTLYLALSNIGCPKWRSGLVETIQFVLRNSHYASSNGN